MSSGGGGQSGNTQYNWNPEMGRFWVGDNGEGVLHRGVGVLNTPYEKYPDQRIADLTPDQTSAMNLIRNTAQNGSALGNAGREQARATVEGDYLSGDRRNPWAETYSTANRNQYEGDNPYFRNTVQTGMEDITNAYNRGTAADTTRMFNLSGAFGGSAHQNAVANNEAGLGRNLSRYANEMGNQQYDRSANLQEGYLGRDLQNQQFNLNRGTNAWENERARQVGSIPGAMSGDQQAYTAAGQLMGAGDINRNYNQSLLDQNYGDWSQRQNWERQNLDWISNLLGRAQGSTGSSTTQSGYGANPMSQLLGAGLLARSMF